MLPVAASTTEMVLSTPPARRVVASGENATVMGSSRAPRVALCKAPVLASYPRTKVSPSAVATHAPSGEKASEADPPKGGEMVAVFFRAGKSQIYVTKSPAPARWRPSAENVSQYTGA